MLIVYGCVRSCSFFEKKTTRFITWTKWVRHFFAALAVVVVVVRKLCELFTAVETTKNVSNFFSCSLTLFFYLFMCVFRCIAKELSVDDTYTIFSTMIQSKENCVLSAEKNCCAFKRINPGALLSICILFFYHLQIKIDWNWNGIPRYWIW